MTDARLLALKTVSSSFALAAAVTMSASPVSAKALAADPAAPVAVAAPAPDPVVAPDPAVAPAEPAVNGDIVVTARKRGESIIDVPIAITAISGATLANRNITDLNSLNGNVPGLRYQNTGANRNDRGFVNFTIRGMSVPVTVFVDGVAIPTGSIPGLNNIERVEVVNGPQSAYFGRATFAGAINFITKQPSLTDFSTSGSASYTSLDKAEINGAVEIPIIKDKLAIRVSGRFYDKKGEYENYNGTGRLGDEQTKSISASFLAKPTDNLKIRGYYAAWKDSDGPSAQAALTEADYNCNLGGSGRQVNGLNYVCGRIGSVPANRLSQNNTPPLAALQLAQGQSAVSQDLIDHLGLERRAYQANLLIDWALGGYTLSGAFGKSHNEWGAITDTYNRGNDGTGYSSTVFIPNNDRNTSAEVRLQSPKMSGFSFLAGVNYLYSSNTFVGRAYRPTNATPIAELSRYTVGRANTLGLFGSINYDIVSGLSISAEGRYQWDKVRQDIDFSNTHLDNTFKSFTPRVILSYDVRRNLNLYASYSEGRRPGTFNGGLTTVSDSAKQQILAQFPVPLNVPEEKLTSYEGGLKGNFFDRRITLLAAGYFSQWRGRQISQNIAYTVGTTTQTNTFILPAGSTDLWGVELQATARVNSHLSLDATYDWAHTKILYTSCTECLAINGVLNPVGNSMERYPAHTFSFNATYETPINDEWTGYARGQYLFTGKQYETAANVAYTAPSDVFHLAIGAHNAVYSVELFVRNLTDDKTPTNILRNTNPNASAAQGSSLIVLAPPERRAVGVRVGFKY
jgi:iron complex outermembrane receptor protein